MEIKATTKHIRMSPKKIRLLANLVRGLNVKKALEQLAFSPKAAALPVTKLIKSAIANAEHNFELNKDNLFVKEIRIDEGGMLKRWMPKAHGRATPLRKRISHINLVLGELKDSGIKAGKKAKIEAPLSLEEMAKQGESAVKSTSAKATADKEGKGRATNIEGAGKKGFVNKMFNRKSGGN